MSLQQSDFSIEESSSLSCITLSVNLMTSEAVLGSVTNRAENENAEQEQYKPHVLLIFERDAQYVSDAKKLSGC